MGSVNRPLLALGALLALVALAGAPRLVVDPDAPFRLPDGDPMLVADAALRATTGGDDLVAAVVWRPDGEPLDRDALLFLDGLYERLTAEPALVRTRSPLRAPLLQSEEGVLSAVTPLHPLPDGDVGPGLARLRADPFVAGTLLSKDGALAVLPSWIARDPPDALLVRLASTALADESVRASEEGKAAKQAVEQARLAVVLGTATGPADEEVAKALRGMAAENELVGRWVARADAIAGEPVTAAVEQLLAAVAGAEVPAGVRVAAIGEPVSRGLLAEVYPGAVALLLVALVLGLGIAGGLATPDRLGDGVVAGLVGVLAAGATVGAMGWLGAPQHSVTALAPVAAGALAAAVWLGTPGGVRTLGIVAPLVGIGVACLAVPGVGVGFGAAAASVAIVGVVRSSAEGEEEPARRGALAMGLVVLGLVAVLVQPTGVDPARLVSSRLDEGAGMRALDRAGMATSGQLALVGEGTRPLARPAALRQLRAAQQALDADDVVAGSVSWADFVARLHGAVSGEEGLPEEAALVDQYLLLFGRPDDVRPLVAPDLSVGGGMVRMAPGRGAELGRLAGERDGVVLTGGAARVTRAARDLSARAGVGFVVGVLLGLAAFAARGRRELAALACAGVAIAVVGGFTGAVGVEAAVAGAVAWGVVSALGRSAWGLVLGFVALISPATGPASVGVGLAASAVCAFFVGTPRALARLSRFGHKTVK